MNPMAMNTMGMDRMAMGMGQMQGMMMPGTMPMNMMMVPRCTMKMEATDMGMKNHVLDKGRNGRRHDAEPLHHDVRQHDELLHDDERHAHDDHQHDQRHVQVRND